MVFFTKKKELCRLISFRLDDDLYNKIVSLSSAAGITKGEFIRRQIENGRITLNQEIVAEVPELKRLIGEFGKIGSNLNQIAHYYNGGGMRSREMYDRIQQALSELYGMKYEVEKMGGEFRGYSKARLNKK